MQFALVALAGAVAGIAVWLVVTVLLPQTDSQVRKNLSRGRDKQKETKPESLASAAEPTGLAAFALRVLPDNSKQRLARAVDRAGRPKGYTLEKMALLKVFAPVIGLIGGLEFNMIVGGALGLGVILGLPVLGFFAPNILLDSRAKDRRAAVVLELPNLLDQMVIAVTAGLGFEAAMDNVSRNSDGPLAADMRRCIQEIQIGVPRADAYTAMARRADVPEVSRFVRAVNRANEHGHSISEVLKQHAVIMRTQRRQRAEQAAAKIPTKITIPLVLFLMPVLMIVVMAPPLIRIAREVMHWF